MIPKEKIEAIIVKHDSIEKELSSGSIDPKTYAKKSKEYSDLGGVVKYAKEFLGIDKEKFIEKLGKARVYSPRLPSVLVPQLSKQDYAKLQEKMRKYKGFYIQKGLYVIMIPLVQPMFSDILAK